MYRLQFNDIRLEPTTQREAMAQQIDHAFPGNRDGYDRFMAAEKRRFELMYPCLQKDYSSFKQYFSKEFIKAAPNLSIGRSLIGVLGDYFKDEKLKLSFTFQSKYLGMSAWDCPGAFAILPYVEHAFGIYHTIGGLSEISEAMSRVCLEHGVEIHLNTPVKQLVIENKKVLGAELDNGEIILADETVLNADFGYAMKNLFPPGTLKNIARRKLIPKSTPAPPLCSTWALTRFTTFLITRFFSPKTTRETFRISSKTRCCLKTYRFIFVMPA